MKKLLWLISFLLDKRIDMIIRSNI